MGNNAGRYITAIFCDDVRVELGNKLSFMGCYQGVLQVPSMPVTLAKLCVYVTAMTPKDIPFKALTLHVRRDDEKDLASVPVSPDELEKAQSASDETATRFGISTAIVFSPFNIEKSMVLRLFATTEDGELVGPRIRIQLAPEQVA